MLLLFFLNKNQINKNVTLKDSSYISVYYFIILNQIIPTTVRLNERIV